MMKTFIINTNGIVVIVKAESEAEAYRIVREQN